MDMWERGGGQGYEGYRALLIQIYPLLGPVRCLSLLYLPHEPHLISLPHSLLAHSPLFPTSFFDTSFLSFFTIADQCLSILTPYILFAFPSCSG